MRYYTWLFCLFLFSAPHSEWYQSFLPFYLLFLLTVDENNVLEPMDNLFEEDFVIEKLTTWSIPNEKSMTYLVDISF